MILRPRTMSVPTDVICPSCWEVLFRKGDTATITLPDLHDERARLAELLCICDQCQCPTLIGYMPARAFGAW